jgi:hypothetical protein
MGGVVTDPFAALFEEQIEPRPKQTHGTGGLRRRARGRRRASPLHVFAGQHKQTGYDDRARMSMSSTGEMTTGRGFQALVHADPLEWLPALSMLPHSAPRCRFQVDRAVVGQLAQRSVLHRVGMRLMLIPRPRRCPGTTNSVQNDAVGDALEPWERCAARRAAPTTALRLLSGTEQWNLTRRRRPREPETMCRFQPVVGAQGFKIDPG